VGGALGQRVRGALGQRVRGALGQRARAESGQSTVEFAGTIVWIVLAGLFALQLAVAGWTAVSAGNAARTAARLVSRGDSQTDARDNGIKGLAGKGLADASIGFQTGPSGGDEAVVNVPIPCFFPGVSLLKPGITRTAEIPPTG
jgi:Flp pilus assembly protein TadG